MVKEWVLWDGSCGFCARWAHWLELKDSRGRFTVAPYQNAPSPPMSPQLEEKCRRAVHVVTAKGTELGAGRAVLYVLEAIGQPGPWRLLSHPAFRWKVELIYRLVAANRGRLEFLAPRTGTQGR